MKKRTKNLVVLAAVLVVLAGALAVVSAVNAANARKAAAEEETPAVIGGITDPVEFSYTAGETQLSFYLDGDTWRWSGAPELPIMQNYLTRIVTKVQSLTAVRTIDEPDALSEYGLAEPANEFIAKDADGTTLDLLIGGVSGSDRYAMVAGGSQVYTIASALPGYLDTGLFEMVQKESIQGVTEDEAKWITLSSPEKAFTFEKVIRSNGSYIWHANVNGERGVQLAVYEPDGLEMPAKDVLEQVLNALKTQSFTACVDFRPDEARLNSFGLGTPRCTVTVKYTLTDAGTSTLMNADSTKTNGEYTLYIGAQIEDAETGETSYYAMPEGSDLVYTMAASDVDPLLNALEIIGV